MNSKHNSNNINKLLEEFRAVKNEPVLGKVLKISGVGKKDVYNPALLEINGKIYLAGRVESRKDALDSQVLFFEENKRGLWLPIDNSPSFNLEDPFFTKIEDEIIFGGVEVKWKKIKGSIYPFNAIAYKTVFYRGKDIYNLKPFAESPDKMKGIRLVHLPNGKIGVFPRPQGKKGGGTEKIGFIQINTLDSLTPKVIDEAPLLKDNFSSSSKYWGAVNALYVLESGKIGVLGTVAYKEKNEVLHYSAMTFIYDYKAGIVSNVKIIAVRDNFPNTEAKKPRLYDVIFSSALLPTTNEEVLLYVGLSDAAIGFINISNPFNSKFK